MESVNSLSICFRVGDHSHPHHHSLMMMMMMMTGLAEGDGQSLKFLCKHMKIYKTFIMCIKIAEKTGLH